MIERVMRHHKAIVRDIWKLRGDPDYAIELRRSLRKLREVRDNGAPIQVFGSAMGRIR